MEPAELARRIGVTQQTVQQWVSGKATPKASSLDKLVEVSGHPLHWFLLPPEEGEQIFTPDTMKIGPRQRELLQAFSAFPEEDQEKCFKKSKTRKINGRNHCSVAGGTKKPPGVTTVQEEELCHGYSPFSDSFRIRNYRTRKQLQRMVAR